MSTINIVPSQGIIPFGGLTVLNISYTPTVAEKFDTRAKVCLCIYVFIPYVCLCGFVWLFLDIYNSRYNTVKCVCFILRKLVLMISSNGNGF